MNMPMPEPTRKQKEFAKREGEILSAAISLFEGPHWEQVTVEQISKKADIGKGTIYKHFSCKEEIYAHIALGFNRRLMTMFKSVEQTPDILATLQTLIRVAFNFFISNPAEARVNISCKREDFRERLPEGLRAAFEEVETEFQEFVTATLQRGMHAGLIPERPIENLLVGLEATFEGAINMMWNQSIRTVSCHTLNTQEDFITVISEFMLAGLAGVSPLTNKAE
jgi:AcrR family transcriptional regulator